MIIGTGAISVTFPAMTFPALARPTFAAWHNRSKVSHKAEIDKWAALGYRTVSLSIHGGRSDTKYTAVMIKRPQVHAERQYFGINAATVQTKFNEMAKKGWGPYLITATGPANNPIMAISFRPMKSIPLTRFGLTKDDLKMTAETVKGPDGTEAVIKSLAREQYDKGNILRSLDAYGSDSNPRYVAIWMPNTEKAEWNCSTIDQENKTSQEIFSAMVQARARPDLLAVHPNGNITESFTDSSIGPWIARSNMSSAKYQDEFTKAVAMGFYPHRVAAGGIGTKTKFAAIFTKQENLNEKVFKSVGPRSIKAIDSKIEQFMKDHQLNASAFAVINGNKLVYAKGYRWADTNYPEITPESTFRLASISKLFTATALYCLRDKALKKGSDFPLTRTLQDILNLKQPDGSQPEDNRFKDITLKHLLESTSGIANKYMWDYVKAAKDFNQPLPATIQQLARYITKYDLEYTPGDTKNVIYGNAAYFMLSAVLLKLTGATSYIEALNIALLNPLGVAGIHQSRSLIGEQPNSEVPYAVQRLPWGNSSKDDSRAIVARQYGVEDYEIFSGSGGLSGSIVAVARLAAMFSTEHYNPALSKERMIELLDNAVNATQNYSGKNKGDAHGYHGLDKAYKLPNIDYGYQGIKGGYLVGSQSSIDFTTGGISFVFMYNGNSRKKLGVTTKWTEAKTAALAVDWDDKSDLFPTYGMTSLPTGPYVMSPAVKQKLFTESIGLNDIDLTEQSMQIQLEQLRYRDRAENSDINFNARYPKRDVK